jgi:cobyrinic acid a,c-diamide synthase
VNLPRLIIADDIRAGMVPMSIILIYALKRSGIKVTVFTSARGEADMRLLKLLLGDRIISLDSYACGSTKNLKTLFQKAASPDALNIVLIPLGTRQEENYIQVNPEVIDIAKTLSCGVVPIISASASPILTTNATLSALSALENAYAESVLGVIFSSVKNPREYQLLEQEYGRKTHILNLGYIPKEVERPLPSMQDLYNTAAGIMQIKSAALQLVSASYHIEWEILDAFGQLKKQWTPSEALSFSPKNFKIAIVGGQSLSLEGDNCRELFQLLKCGVIDYDPWQDQFPKEAEAVYFPHSAANMYGDRLLAHEPFLQGIKQSFAANKLIFVNGASAPLFGKSFTTADGQKHEALGFFNFRGNYVSAKSNAGAKKIEARGSVDSFFCKHDEKMRGYALNYVNISNPGNVVPPVLAYRDIRKDAELGVSGWVKGYCFVTDLYIELWSNVEIINRWLALRKR